MEVTQHDIRGVIPPPEAISVAFPLHLWWAKSLPKPPIHTVGALLVGKLGVMYAVVGAWPRSTKQPLWVYMAVFVACLWVWGWGIGSTYYIRSSYSGSMFGATDISSRFLSLGCILRFWGGLSRWSIFSIRGFLCSIIECHRVGVYMACFFPSMEPFGA